MLESSIMVPLPLTSFKESLLDILPGLAGAYLSSVMRLKHLTLIETLKILLEKDTALHNKITVSNFKRQYLIKKTESQWLLSCLSR